MPTQHPRPPAKVRMVPARDRSTDLNDARFTVKAVVAIVTVTVTLLGGQWLTTANLQSAIMRLDARLDAKDRIDANNQENDQKIAAAEKRSAEDWRVQIEKRLDQIERDYKLNDYDLKALITNKR